ncbi:hypothetical protein [Asanoa iriomotensis]|uniref:Uncharacterized protein n=1 Tax=Asanoa iriomotensis TaxID=234613 RepID=A0ABQ4CFT0_9ACTN|nr:hypothetical protein [Asanoa iriomotensis]GIF61623.1 hypothetical protein Air01nite_77180 [Asanoa iriomotensis]
MTRVAGGGCLRLRPACQGRRSAHPPTDQDVGIAHGLLDQVGADEVTVRLARPDDPAPSGTLLYAARFPDGCIMGHVKSFPAGDGSYQLVGPLPDGSCLSG